MAYIEIENLIIKDTTINISFFDREVIGIYSDVIQEKKIDEFLFIISGINSINKKCGSCKSLGKDVFDNLNYFKNRVFLDFSLVYTNTLKKEFIAENFINRFQIEFDQDKFKKWIKEFKIRQETTVDVEYKFSEVGNTLVNFSLLNCIDKKNLIISNPTYKVLDERKDIIVKEITNKTRYNNVILKLDNISNFKGYLDKVLFFTRDNKVLLVNGSDTLIVIEENIRLRNIICNGVYNNVICLNDYSKEELKDFDKRKIKYKVISIYDIDKYRGEAYAKE